MKNYHIRIKTYNGTHRTNAHASLEAALVEARRWNSLGVHAAVYKRYADDLWMLACDLRLPANLPTLVLTMRNYTTGVVVEDRLPARPEIRINTYLRRFQKRRSASGDTWRGCKTVYEAVLEPPEREEPMPEIITEKGIE